MSYFDNNNPFLTVNDGSAQEADFTLRKSYKNSKKRNLGFIPQNALSVKKKKRCEQRKDLYNSSDSDERNISCNDRENAETSVDETEAGCNFINDCNQDNVNTKTLDVKPVGEVRIPVALPYPRVTEQDKKELRQRTLEENNMYSLDDEPKTAFPDFSDEETNETFQRLKEYEEHDNGRTIAEVGVKRVQGINYAQLTLDSGKLGDEYSDTRYQRIVERNTRKPRLPEQPTTVTISASDTIARTEPMNIAYIRVSTKEQNTGRQNISFENKGIHIDKVFSEKISGKNRNRPMLTQMLIFLKPGDTIYVTELSRLARSAQDLYDISQEIISKGARLISLKESFDLNTTTGRFIFGIMAAIAQFERETIKERQKEGIAYAKEQGKRWGKERVYGLNERETHELMLRYHNNEIIADEAVKLFGSCRQTFFIHYKQWKKENGYDKKEYRVRAVSHPEKSS